MVTLNILIAAYLGWGFYQGRQRGLRVEIIRIIGLLIVLAFFLGFGLFTDDFKQGNYELGAQASAVAIKKGASKNADFDKGVAVFTQTRGGLMFDASVGGQKFTFEPK